MPKKNERLVLPPLMRTVITILGTSFVMIGLLLYLNQFFPVAWLCLVILLVDATIFLLLGFRQKNISLIIPAMIGLLLDLACLLIFGLLQNLTLFIGIGIACLAVSLAFLSVPLITLFFGDRIALWPLVPASLFLSTGLCFLFSKIAVFDFVLFIGLGLGFAFLVWGWYGKSFGLTIPGALILSGSLSIFLAWGSSASNNPLTQTGIMLVWFSLGWALIIVSYRLIRNRFIWWPLIPCGVILATGLGLFIGGKPGGMLNFIGNAGSIGLILFGVYLLLMRRTIHK
jgi:hypothetical protein